MIRIAALNESSVESCNEEDVGPSQEVLEAEAARKYREAIGHLAKDDFESAREAFLDVLANPFIERANWNEGTERSKTLPQNIALKYSCFKNLANIYMSMNGYEEACSYYIQAVQLDGSEVVLWQRLGAAAIKVKDYQLALISFQEGLLVNPLHWPCLDQLLSVLFLLGFYDDCLGLIIQALKRDPSYVKGLAFKDKIFEFQPSLKTFVKDLYAESDILFKDVEYNKKKGDEFVCRCLELRPPPAVKEPGPPSSSRKLEKNIEKLSWENLSYALISTYDSVLNEDAEAITEKLLLEEIVEYHIFQKLKAKKEKELKKGLFCPMKPGRRMNRSLSQNDDQLKFYNSEIVKEDETGNNASIKSKLPARRQTIELGECQNSFRVGKRNGFEETETSIKKSNLDSSVSSTRDIKIDKLAEDFNSDRNTESNTLEDKKSFIEAVDNEIPELPKDNGKTQDVDEMEFVAGEPAENQAAINQLSDIMALKSSYEMLSLPIPEFVDEQEYFEGGVYEEDDEGDMEESDPLEDGADKIKEIGTSIAVNKLGEQKMEDQETENMKKQVTDCDKESSQDTRNSGNHKEMNETVIQNTDKNVSKKPKRNKRGLERELEQLDYWGRRKAREAKRRRRTLTSKLVGIFEENENLTWHHLLRSFIPAGLLSSEPDIKTNTENDKFEGGILNPEPFKDDAVPLEVIDIGDSTTNVNVEEKDSDRLNNFLNLYPHLRAHWDKICETSSYWSTEELQVADFLCMHKENGGIFHVLQQFQKSLLRLFGIIWPQKLAQVYREIYNRVRCHITIGSIFSLDGDSKAFKDFGMAALAYIELLISISLANGTSFQKDDENSPTEQELQYLEDDFFQLNLLLERPDIWLDSYLQLYLRIGWIHAQLKILQGIPEEGVEHLQLLCGQMKLSQREENQNVTIQRHRVTEDTTILTLTEVLDQLNFLQRSQMLDQLEEKYSSGCYEEVAAILIRMFHKLPKSSCELPSISRCTQLSILINSLANLKDNLRTIEWGSLSLTEAIEIFQKLNSEAISEKKAWEATIKSLLIHIYDAFILEDLSNILRLKNNILPKLLGALVDILVLQLEVSPEASLPCFGTLSSWLLFYSILYEYEQHQKIMKKNNHNENSKSNGQISAISTPSTLFLITAHEELGKNGWCALEEGRLLMLTMDVLIEELSGSLSDEQQINLHQSVEQVAFCLYSHPSRKTKHKHLKDHGVHQIALTWNRAVQLYSYFSPKQLPDFQSTQFSSISDDVSTLFKRIISLLPEEFKHTNQIEKVDEFIENGTMYDTFSIPSELKDCYYLLGDYYFKSKNWESAVYYYKLDVSVNPERLNAWAPMGLAKKVQLETLLNSCEVIDNLEYFFKQAQTSRKCLEKALSIDKYYCNLWVEKGGLVYMTHSHASRLLKQDLDPDMSIERFEALENIKNDSLLEAKKCFLRATQIVEEGWDDESLPDERWLYEYMLGKVAEKSNQPIEKVLNHYLVAGKHLHEIGAKYPNKISYSNPQDNAVEAMEMFYRIVCCILKHIQLKEERVISHSQLVYFKDTLNDLLRSPFAMCTEYKGFSNKSTFRTNKNSNESVQPEKRKFCLLLSEGLIQKSLNKALESVKSKIKSQDPASKPDNNIENETSVTKEDIQIVLNKCLECLKLCVTRFPHHYKSLYRLAYYFHHSKYGQDNNKSRNFLLGSDFWQRVGYMPINGLFNERKMWLQNARVCNLFHGVWRIPHDEIDRPGSFAAHMYRCVCLCLDVLQEMRDFFTVLEIAISLKQSPEKDKKYLRDNERELLCEHSTQVGLQTMKDKYRYLFKTSSPSNGNSQQHSFLTEVHKAYKHVSRHFPNLESHFAKMLSEAFISYKGVKADAYPNVLREADLFCMKTLAPNTQQSSASTTSITLSVSNVAKRGRPPGATRGRAVDLNQSFDSSGDSLAVQQAYKVYEQLIHTQTMLTNENLQEKARIHYRNKYDDYKQQMLKYLQIPSVSCYFHKSLQSMGSSASKLPPPPPTMENNASKSEAPTTQSSPEKQQMITSLAAKSHIHGISISTVSKKTEPGPSYKPPVKPSMSITVSQSPKGSTSSIKQKLSGVCITRVPSKNEAPASSAVAIPKLPEGTTLSRQLDSSPSVSKSKDTPVIVNTVEISKSSKKPVSVNSNSKSNESTTKSADSKTKRPAINSFQAAFQAAISSFTPSERSADPLGSTPDVDLTYISDNEKDPLADTDTPASVSLTKVDRENKKSLNEDPDEADVITLD